MEKMNLKELVLLVLTFCSTHAINIADDLSDDVLEKRAPGWGKKSAGPASNLGYLQSVLSDLSRYEVENDDSSDIDRAKRRPGWGKRSYPSEFELIKRRPGWGKRAYDYDLDTLETTKRAPGWGKRSFTINKDSSDDMLYKRAPGWGKRSMYEGMDLDKRRPGWGKRAPGWGKRSDDIMKCQSLINDIRILRLKIYQLKEEAPEMCPNLYQDDEDDTS